MILHPAFRVEPWALHETELHLDILAQSESLFALSNGHIGLRATSMRASPRAARHVSERILRTASFALR